MNRRKKTLHPDGLDPAPVVIGHHGPQDRPSPAFPNALSAAPRAAPVLQAKKRSKKAKDKKVLNNVVSLRVSDQEKQVLEAMTRSSSKNVSDIVREAIDLWLCKQRSFAGSS